MDPGVADTFGGATGGGGPAGPRRLFSVAVVVAPVASPQVRGTVLEPMPGVVAVTATSSGEFPAFGLAHRAGPTPAGLARGFPR